MTHIDDVLYARIVRQMPIPCVDLLVQNTAGLVLMVRRVNPPAEGEFWFPGGRVLHGESRRDAAVRKLRQECGLEGEVRAELGTFDAILSSPWGLSHAITTFFRMRADGNVVLDAQSSGFAWKSARGWCEVGWSSRDLTRIARDMLVEAVTP